jgi:hypothetical protein
MTDPDRQRAEAERRSRETEAEWRGVGAVVEEYDRQPQVDRRQLIDDKFADIHKEIAEIKREVAENTDLTKQIRDLLASFRVLAQISKWGTAVGAFGLMLYHVWQRATGR